MKTKNSITTQICWLFSAAVALVAAAPLTAAAAASAGSAAAPASSGPAVSEGFRFSEMLPLAWQKRPKIQFNVVTEMWPAGRMQRVPTSANPLYYHYATMPGQFVQAGALTVEGEKPPPQIELERAMSEVLAANGYLLANERQRPDLLIVLHYGSHGADNEGFGPPDPNMENAFSSSTATELVNAVIRDIRRMNDVVERARLVAGDRIAHDLKQALEGEILNRVLNRTYARHNAMLSRTNVGGEDAVPATPIPILPVNPASDSPFQLFLRGGRSNEDLMRPLMDTIFLGCYFVAATAFDFDGVAARQRVPLWRTKMTVEAQGVSLEEVLRPLIVSTGAYLGREMLEPAVIHRRIDRKGDVDVGRPTVIGGQRPDPIVAPR